MNRTLVWKVQERELSEKLYKKLQGLTLIYTPTEEFRKCLSDDMFVKPNSQAFFAVMHFLFRLLDPAEFKKRFYWPITDKRGESNFRTSTVEYLTHLNEKHQLHWDNIKSYLVVMPGGIKFITFLLEFVSFVVQELTRNCLRVKHLSLSCPSTDLDVSTAQLKSMQRKNKFFKEYASQFMDMIQEKIVLLRENIQGLKQKITIMSLGTGLSVVELSNGSFCKLLEQDSRELHQRMLVRPSTQIISLNEPLILLEKTIENFLSKSSGVKYNGEEVNNALREIADFFPDLKLYLPQSSISLSSNESPKFHILINVFNCIYDEVISRQQSVSKKAHLSQFVRTDLDSLSADVQELEKEIVTFQKELNDSVEKRNKENEFRTPIRTALIPNVVSDTHEYGLLQKFVYTPPIKIEIDEFLRSNSIRLPLMDDFNVPLLSDSASTTLQCMLNTTQSTRKLGKPLESFAEPKRTKIMDPIRLLRTINKERPKSRQQQKLSISASTIIRDCKNLFSSEKSPYAKSFITPQKLTQTQTKMQYSFFTTPTSSAQSPNYSSFNSSDVTRVARSPLAEKSNNSLLCTKKLPIVKKVLDASLSLHDVSTSPSGCLNPLVTAEIEVPKLFLNDVQMEQKHVEMLKKHDPIPEVKQIHISDENNLNIFNKEAVLNSASCVDTPDDNDMLFNTSDSVLQNVSM